MSKSSFTVIYIIQGILNIKVMLAALAIIHISMDRKFIMTIMNFKWTLYMSSINKVQNRWDLSQKTSFYLHYALWNPTLNCIIAIAIPFLFRLSLWIIFWTVYDYNYIKVCFTGKLWKFLLIISKFALEGNYEYLFS